MTFYVPEKVDIASAIDTVIPEALERAIRQRDSVLYPSGVAQSLPLRDRSNRTWRDNWTINLRDDGKLTLVYHKRKLRDSIHIQVTNPVRQRAFGISIHWLRKLLPRPVLGRTLYLLNDATGDPYAGYSYPLWAFSPPRSGRL